MLDHNAGLCSAPSQLDKYNLTKITSKCVALCYFLFVLDAGLNRVGVIGAIKRPKCICITRTIAT